MEFKNIIEYLPEYFREYKEVQAVIKAEQKKLTNAYNSIFEALDNTFIASANEDGIKRFENILGIKALDSSTLEERRLIVMSRYNKENVCTEETLRKKLSDLLGEDNFSIDIDNANYTVDVRVALESKRSYDEAVLLVEKMVPANMAINVDLKYNKHIMLAEKTHQELSAYTHEQLRKDVFTSGYYND